MDVAVMNFFDIWPAWASACWTSTFNSSEQSSLLKNLNVEDVSVTYIQATFATLKILKNVPWMCWTSMCATFVALTALAPTHDSYICAQLRAEPPDGQTVLTRTTAERLAWTSSFTINHHWSVLCEDLHTPSQQDDFEYCFVDVFVNLSDDVAPTVTSTADNQTHEHAHQHDDAPSTRKTEEGQAHQPLTKGFAGRVAARIPGSWFLL